MGKAKKRPSAPVEEHEETEIPDYVMGILASTMKIYAKDFITEFLSRKNDRIQKDLTQLLQELATMSKADRDKKIDERLDASNTAKPKKKKIPKKPGEPKKFQTAYFLWSASMHNEDIQRQYPEIYAQIKDKTLMPAKAKSLIWKDLSADVKQEWSDKSADDRERYYEEMEKFDSTFRRPAASRPASRAASRASSPEPPKKPKKKAAEKTRDASPVRPKATKKPVPEKRAKAVQEAKPQKKTKKAAKSSSSSVSSSSSESENNGGTQAEGSKAWL